MVEGKQITIGFILLTLLLSGVVYLTLDHLKIRVDNDKTTFYTKLLDENGEPYGRFLVAGREYNSLFDGTSKMNRQVSEITIDEEINGDFITIKRTTPYIRGPIVIDTYTFNGSSSDVELFPVSHDINILNAEGYFYRYEVRDLEYNGISKNLESVQMSFEKNMKVEWLQKNLRWAKVYSSGILKLQYDIPSDNEIYKARLFDPILTEDYNFDSKYYKAEKTVEIKKHASLGIFENMDSSYNLTLISDTNVPVIFGNDREIARFQIEVFDGIKSIDLDKITFIDMKDNKKAFNKDYTLKYLTFEVVQDYIDEDVCETVTRYNFNITADEEIEECTTTRSKTLHNKTIEVWKTFKDGYKFNEETLTIGLFVDVERGEAGDWVPTFSGIDIEQWATWNDTYNLGLKTANKFDESSGTVAVDSRTTTHNITLTNTDDTNWVPGINNNAMNFSGVDEYGTMLNSTGFNGNAQFTVCWWQYVRSYADLDMPVSLDQIGSREWFVRFVTGDILRLDIIGFGNSDTTSWTTDKWENICAGQNTTHNYIYTKGIFRDSHTSTGMGNTAVDLRIGYSGAYGTYADLIIDELTYWNRSLSPAEILQMNDSTFYSEPTIVVNLNSPIDDYTSYENRSITFNCTATDTELLNISLYIDSTLNSTITNTTASQSKIELYDTIDNLPITGTWKCIADNSADSESSSIYNFFIKYNLTGTVTDGASAIADAIVYIQNMTSHNILGNTTSNATGGWTYGPVPWGNYTVFGYELTNQSRAGDIKPHISIP